MMKSIRVLVAERNPLMRSGIACLLDEASDITIVGEARSGEQTIALAGEMNVDVVLLDAQMPDLSGSEIAREFQDQARPPKIVAMIEQADEAEMFKLIASGALGLVARRDEPGVLLEAIRSVAAGQEVWMSPRVAARLVPKPGRTAEASGLSARERELLHYVARGYRNEQIAEALGISAGTVRNHLSSIYGKLRIHTRSEAVAWAWRSGLVRPEDRSDE